MRGELRNEKQVYQSASALAGVLCGIGIGCADVDA